MDDEAARAESFDAAIGQGNHQWAVVHRMLRELTGPNGTITRVEIQFRSPNIKGQVLTARGRVTSRADDSLALDIWTEDQHGTTLGVGTASVTLPS